MDTVVCDEFLLPDPLTPCGALVALPEQHIAFHTFLESWMKWLIKAGREAYKSDIEKAGDIMPDMPATPDRRKRF